jgi:hypothetical protein
MELGRIVLLTDGEAYCFIRRTWLTKIFLVGDIISFIMQGAGNFPTYPINAVLLY